MSTGELRMGMRDDEARALLAECASRAPLRFVGGAPVVDVAVGTETFACTMDTGSPGPVSLGASHAARARAVSDEVAASQATSQVGVNGEVVESEIRGAHLTVCGVVPADSAGTIFLNSSEVDHSDGYVGMGVLRAFDILLLPGWIAMRPSGLGLRQPRMYAASP